MQLLPNSRQGVGQSLLTMALAAGLAACGTNPVYLAPSEGQPAATVKVNVYYSSRNFYEMLAIRGDLKCSNLSVLRLLDIKEAAPSTTLAIADPRRQPTEVRLPAGRPLALRYTERRVDEARNWDFVVLLEPGGSYEATLDTRTGPSMVDTATKAEAFRLPHDWFLRNLNCP